MTAIIEPESDEERAVIAAYHRMDAVTKLIFLTGLRAMGSGRLTADEFEAWVSERIARHKAGEELTLGDLEIPEAAA